MLDFFKKFLKPREKVIKFSELNEWLDTHNSELENIKECLRGLEMSKLEISESLKALEKVDVSSAKVEEKVKHIVQGNLPAYANTISIFLRRMMIPKEANPVSLEIFCNTFDKEFDSLNKRTFRNFQIIRELVGKELEDVARSVKSLELLVKELKKSSEKVKEISELKEKVGLIKNSLESKEKNDLKRQELQKSREELLQLCEGIIKEIENLKNSNKAKDLESLRTEEKKISDSIKCLENQSVTLFSPLQKALKKYNNICFIKKVGSYIENPAEALLNDDNLEILSFLKDVKKMIEEGKIEIKDDKKKKTAESLDKLDESFIKKFIAEHSSLKKGLSLISKQIKSNTILKEISDLERELNIQKFKIENVEREINKIRDLDIKSEITALEKRLGEVFSFKVKIENVMG